MTVLLTVQLCIWRSVILLRTNEVGKRWTRTTCATPLIAMKQKSDNNGTRNCRSHRPLAMRYVLTQKLWRQAGGQSVNDINLDEIGQIVEDVFVHISKCKSKKDLISVIVQITAKYCFLIVCVGVPSTNELPTHASPPPPHPQRTVRSAVLNVFVFFRAMLRTHVKIVVSFVSRFLSWIDTIANAHLF